MSNRNVILLGQAHIVRIDHQLAVYDIAVIIYLFIYVIPHSPFDISVAEGWRVKGFTVNEKKKKHQFYY